MGNRIQLTRGDITRFDGDAIVNAANSSLLGGGGVDGAIHRAAGPELVAECRLLGGCPTGQARITRGYRLPARHVIHTVGPVWEGGGRGEADLLASCYRASLDLAAANGCRSVAFPAISCGVFGYPLDAAASVSLEFVSQWLAKQALPEVVTWVLFDPQAWRAWRQAASDLAIGVDELAG